MQNKYSHLSYHKFVHDASCGSQDIIKPIRKTRGRSENDSWQKSFGGCRHCAGFDKRVTLVVHNERQARSAICQHRQYLPTYWPLFMELCKIWARFYCGNDWASCITCDDVTSTLLHRTYGRLFVLYFELWILICIFSYSRWLCSWFKFWHSKKHFSTSFLVITRSFSIGVSVAVVILL